MPQTSRLEILLRDANDRPIREAVDVNLLNLATGNTTLARGVSGARIVVRDLTPGAYRVAVDPPSYLSAGRFVSVPPGGQATLTQYFAVDPTKVTPRFSSHGSLASDAKRLLSDSDQVLGFEGQTGRTLYDALDDIRRAGFLNIMTKTAATPLVGSGSVVSSIEQLTELRGDRFFAVVPQTLREDVKNSAQAGLFEPAPDRLHHPPAGFERAGSWKTIDRYGNLQLSFFTNGTDWRADIDIDDANGLAHVFQVLRNELHDRATHPYDIHQILRLFQRLDPGYDLQV